MKTTILVTISLTPQQKERAIILSKEKYRTKSNISRFIGDCIDDAWEDKIKTD